MQMLRRDTNGHLVFACAYSYVSACLSHISIEYWGKAEGEKKCTAGHAQFANSLFVPDFSQFTHSAHFIQALVEFHVPFPFEVTIFPSGPKLAITWYRCIAIKSFTLPAWACLLFLLWNKAKNTQTQKERSIRLVWSCPNDAFVWCLKKKFFFEVLQALQPGKVSLKSTLWNTKDKQVQ